MSQPLVIAVDGPAASGKGTIASALAALYGLPHLDTGLLYRAVGVAVLAAGGRLDDEAGAAKIAADLDLARLDQPEYRTRQAGEAASQVAVHPAVRLALLKMQQDFARRPGGAVIDGRDIGTVIAPDAVAKLFVTASPGVRADRRHRRPGGGSRDCVARRRCRRTRCRPIHRRRACRRVPSYFSRLDRSPRGDRQPVLPFRAALRVFVKDGGEENSNRFTTT